MRKKLVKVTKTKTFQGTNWLYYFTFHMGSISFFPWNEILIDNYH